MTGTPNWSVTGGYTLTIRNLYVVADTGIESSLGTALTLVLEGANYITYTGGNGIDTGTESNSSLTINGTGALSVTGATEKARYGIYVYAGNMTVESGTINVTAGVTNSSNSAIKCQEMRVNGGTVVARGGAAAGNYSTSYGVEGAIAITGGTVVAEGGSGTYGSYGVNGVVKLSGGVVVARAGEGKTAAQAIRGDINSNGNADGVKVISRSPDGTTINTETLGTSFSTITDQDTVTAAVVVPGSFADGSTTDLFTKYVIDLDKNYYIVNINSNALKLNDPVIYPNGYTLVAVSLYEDPDGDYSGGVPSSGIRLGDNEGLLVQGQDKGGNIIAVSLDGLGSRGIKAGVVDIHGGTSVTAIGGYSGGGVDTVGINAEVSLSEGSVTAIGGKGAFGSNGISGTTNVYGGTLNAIGGQGDIESLGIGGDLKVFGGTVNAVGNTHGISGATTVKYDTTEITGGTVNATGGTYGLKASSGSLTAGSFTGGTAAVSGSVSTILDTGYAYYDGNEVLTVADNATTVGDAGHTITVAKPHIHTVCGTASCGADHDKDGTKENHEAVVWTGISTQEELEAIDKEGYYYLKNDIALAPESGSGMFVEWQPADGVVLCLNGKKISSKDDDAAPMRIRIYDDVEFTLTDCVGTGTVESSNNPTVNNDGEGAVFNLYAGTIKNTNASAFAVGTHKTAVTNQYGGTIGGEGTVADGVEVSGEYHYYSGEIKGKHSGVVIRVVTNPGTGEEYYGKLVLHSTPSISGDADISMDDGTLIEIADKLDEPAEPLSIWPLEPMVIVFTEGWNTMENADYDKYFVPALPFLDVTENSDGELVFETAAITQQPKRENEYTVGLTFSDGTAFEPEDMYGGYQWYEVPEGNLTEENLTKADLTEVNGQTEKQLTAGESGKTYVCIVTLYADGPTLMSDPVVFVPIERYPLYIGGVQVTDVNKDDILGDADGTSNSVQYDPDTNTLTLNDAKIEGIKPEEDALHEGAGIYYNGHAMEQKPLNLVLNGTNNVTAGEQDSGVESAVRVTGAELIISGNGTLNAMSNDEDGDAYGTSAIYISGGSLTVESGTVNAEATSSASAENRITNNYAIYADYDITINGGTVKAIATANATASAGIFSDQRGVTIDGDVNLTAMGGSVIPDSDDNLDGYDGNTTQAIKAHNDYTITIEDGNYTLTLTDTDGLETVLNGTDPETTEEWNNIISAVMEQPKATGGSDDDDDDDTSSDDKASHRSCPRDETCPIHKFDDTRKDTWYHDGVHYCLENGYMIGTGDTTFKPDISTERGMIATMLYRLEGKPETDGVIPYDDIPEDAWFTDAVIWADASGVVTGYPDGNYGPGDPITREQLAAMLYRYAKYKGMDVSVGESTNILSYNDAESVSEYAVPAMQWACGAGIIQGDAGNLMPTGLASRAEVATMFMRFCEMIK